MEKERIEMQTLKILVEEWFYEYERNMIKPSSAACYYTHIYNHIIPKLGVYDIHELKTFDLQKYFFELYETGRIEKKGGLSGKTVQDNYIVLNNFYNYLVTKGVIQQNPCFGIRLPKDYKNPIRVLSRGEQRRIEEVVRRSKNENSFGIILCLYTGIRIGELCGLRMEDVELSQKILHVRGTVQRIKNIDENSKATTVVYGTPKSIASIRDIPLADSICEILKERMSKKRVSLLAPKKGNFVEPRVYQKHFQYIVKEAGIKSANFHSLRHTFATRALESGMDYKTLSELLGHSNPTITLKTYAHSLLEEKRRAINLVGDLYSA